MLDKIIEQFISTLIAAGVFVLLLVLIDQARRAIERRQERRRRLNLGSCADGHDWRYITSPYVQQCKRRDCGLVQFNGQLPDGLKEYVDEMTAPAPRKAGR